MKVRILALAAVATGLGAVVAAPVTASAARSAKVVIMWLVLAQQARVPVATLVVTPEASTHA